MSPQDLARYVAALAYEKKARDIVVLDVEALVRYCDSFVLCTASNPRQVRAIANHLLRELKGFEGLRRGSVEGLNTARWVLVDFGDIVVHVFDEEARVFYDLDGLWSDAPKVELGDLAALLPDRTPMTQAG
ncbi:MAG: ribosome silencing factor [Alphaproteobacteria bacterium]|nr:ribosome silencing factor [Alphaproteobacteria bacterium]